jgi:hypothetical protein
VCPDDADPDQADADGDGIGDACDPSTSTTDDGGMETGGPETDGMVDESGSMSGTTASTTGEMTSAGSEETTGAASDDGGGGCGCSTPLRGSGWPWLALVIVPVLRRRRAQGGIVR